MHTCVADPSRGEETETTPGYSLMGLFNQLRHRLSYTSTKRRRELFPNKCT